MISSLAFVVRLSVCRTVAQFLALVALFSFFVVVFRGVLLDGFHHMCSRSSIRCPNYCIIILLISDERQMFTAFSSVSSGSRNNLTISALVL